MSTIDRNNQYVDSSEEITSNKEECTSCKQTDVDDIAISNDTSTCANCGKEGVIVVI